MGPTISVDYEGSTFLINFEPLKGLCSGNIVYSIGMWGEGTDHVEWIVRDPSRVEDIFAKFEDAIRCEAKIYNANFTIMSDAIEGWDAAGGDMDSHHDLYNMAQFAEYVGAEKLYEYTSASTGNTIAVYGWHMWESKLEPYDEDNYLF